MKESIFTHALRVFIVTICSCLGIAFGLILIIVALSALSSLSDDGCFSSSVKIMPDAQGSRKELPSSTPVLLQMKIHGTIGEDGLKASKIEEILLKSREEDFKHNRVKGILLVINSPGGDANDSDLIYHMLKQYKERYKVPIYTYVEGLCASGGYYIALASDKIYTSDVSLVGSIGVLSWPPYFNVSKVLEKWQIDALTLTAGKNKDALNPTRPWKSNESENMQELIDFFYAHFTSIVSENRPLVDKEKLEKIFGAKVFPAPLAQEYGFIDGIHYSLSDALAELASAAGIQKEEKYQVVSIETKEWLKKLFQDKSFLFTGKLKLDLPQILQQENVPVKYLYTP